MRSLGVPGDTGGEGGSDPGCPWAGGTHLRCLCISASLGRKIEGVGAAGAVGLLGGLGCGSGSGGLLGEQEGASLAPAVKIHLPHQDLGLVLPSCVLPNAAATRDGE